MSDARQTRYDRRRRSCRTNSEFDSIRGEYRFFECRKTGSQTESKNRFIRFFPYRYTTIMFLLHQLRFSEIQIQLHLPATVLLQAANIVFFLHVFRCSESNNIFLALVLHQQTSVVLFKLQLHLHLSSSSASANFIVFLCQ